ncbi:MAG TPA: VOC family protein [Sphingomonadaceae bacterium]|nr:VOC family protein [Sphingomonadaceae bacterium]
MKTSLAFFKLNTPDMARALDFYRRAFGFTVTMTFDEDEFLEHIMALPGQESGPNLLLVEYKDAREVGVGPGHGPVGFMTDDIEAQFAKAMGAGAVELLPIFEMGGTKIAMLLDPDGHEIELVQPPAG